MNVIEDLFGCSFRKVLVVVSLMVVAELFWLNVPTHIHDTNLKNWNQAVATNHLSVKHSHKPH